MTDDQPRILSPGQAADRRSLPFATRLLWLVLSIIIPATLIAAGGLYSAYDAEKSATEELLLRATRTLAGHLDLEFAKLLEAAGAATATTPEDEDIVAVVRERLHRRGVLEGASFIISLPTGAVAATSGDLPATLNAHPRRRAPLRRALHSGAPEISAFLAGDVGEPLILIDSPFPEHDGRQLLLTVDVTPLLARRLAADGAPGDRDWIGAVVAPDGMVLARTQEGALFANAMGPPGLLERMRARDEDVMQLQEEGSSSAATVAFSRTPGHDWRYVVTYPQHRLRAAYNRSLAALAALGVVAILGLAHIYYLSRQLVRPVSRLTAAARCLARGETIPMSPTGVTEFDDIQAALRDAGQQVAARNAERDQVEAMLRASEQRLRLAMEASELGAWSYDPAKNELVGSERSRALLGLPPGRIDLETLTCALAPERREEQRAALVAAVRGREPFIMEICVQWPDGSRRWIEVRGRPVMRANGPPTVVGVVHEVTERRTAADRQRLLMRELNHRVKNSLATVQSIALLTRRSTSPEEAWEAFEKRLIGLAKTHDLLTASDWRGAWLDDAINAELQPYQSPDHARISAFGPRLRLHPRATLTLCMCFHELATNAAKYGALSRDSGRVSVTWRIEERPPGGVLALEWRESGGPPVKAPQRKGLGSRLLDRSLQRELGGVVTMDWAPDGLRCRMELPLKAIVADDAGEAA
ncbi:sensor histidine kinase [Camelimonas abortus]|uniref:Blue-light-activated histidine kinase n=1 Tax=Camelimonas abortus TaxID=1017184 RepID=A0ABV7LCJ7_9HYPH